MKNDYLGKIIANYKAQCELYNQLLHLSSRQVELLKDNKETVAENIHSLLMTRKIMMDEVATLNEVNKNLQEALLVDLKLERFSLSVLEGVVEPTLYNELKEVISSMSTLLYQINENDKINEALIRQNFRQKRAISTSKASGAYQKAMQNSAPEKPAKP